MATGERVMPSWAREMLRVYTPDELGPDGYPLEWHDVGFIPTGFIGTRRVGIKDIIRAEAGHRCIRCHHPYRNGEHGNGEWSPCDEACGYTHVPFRLIVVDDPVPDPPDGSGLCKPASATSHLERVEAQWRILTVHHLNGDKADCRWWNLAALCQRCHLTIQRRVVMERAFMFEHSAWFRPYAAGWYAWKYLGEEIDCEEALARQDELLALERLG